jgi:hypothetical protein
MKTMETPARTHKLPARKLRKLSNADHSFSEAPANGIATMKPAPADPDSEMTTVQLTTIAADINVGLGNTLFIRGEGEGLSWDRGVPLHCIGDSTWTWASTAIKDKAVFKLLLNDAIWAQGDNLTVAAGKDLRLMPVF